MHKCYRRLAYDERCQIRVLLSKGFSMRNIAGDLNRSPATISREMARNRRERGYRHGQAQAMSSARGSEASGVPRKLTEALWSRIGSLIQQGWSPEQVEGRLKRLGEETVGREPNWKGGRHAGRGHIPGRVHTLIADNGKEFAGHREVAEGLDAGFCFATPYHSRERGRNEHVNGLVRQYFPKGVDFRQVTTEQVREVEDRLNHRPRKALGYRTPFEVFHGGLAPS